MALNMNTILATTRSLCSKSDNGIKKSLKVTAQIKRKKP